ncbi:hypothetical protein [Nocardia sp. NPDC051832]|uniref:hypothetical protein n=1 Tax=Nocardia sp. NPDC051832 TaxID=3155673 RepID=UPI00344A1179
MTGTDAATLGSLIGTWTAFKTEAKEGQLKLDTDIGSELAGHAGTMKKQLQAMLDQTKVLAYLDGWGTLDSATELKAKFEQKADGFDDSAVKRLTEAIEVLSLMEDTWKLAIGQLSDRDQQNAANINNVNPGDK